MRESLMGPAGNSCRGGYLFILMGGPGQVSPGGLSVQSASRGVARDTAGHGGTRKDGTTAYSALANQGLRWSIWRLAPGQSSEFPPPHPETRKKRGFDQGLDTDLFQS